MLHDVKVEVYLIADGIVTLLEQPNRPSGYHSVVAGGSSLEAFLIEPTEEIERFERISLTGNYQIGLTLGFFPQDGEEARSARNAENAIAFSSGFI